MLGQRTRRYLVVLLAAVSTACGPDSSDPEHSRSAPAAINVCSVTWTGLAGNGLWQTAGNWSTTVVPQPIDDVCIGAAFTVTLSGADAAINSLTCDGSLSVSSMLTIAATSTIKSLTLSGTLGGNGGVTIASLMNWTAGTVAGSTPLVIAPAARLNMLGGGGYVLTGRTVNNAGLTVLSGA